MDRKHLEKMRRKFIRQTEIGIEALNKSADQRKDRPDLRR
jgi:hypothetical protein